MQLREKYVVLVKFPYLDNFNNIILKKRPALIHSVLDNAELVCIQITSKSRVNTNPGIFIKEPKTIAIMGLQHESFINLSNSYPFLEDEILEVIGICPDVIFDQLLNIIEKQKVTIRTIPY